MNPVGDPMTDPEAELSSFRQQWRAEVSARTQPSSTSPTQPVDGKPNPIAPLPRRLSDPPPTEGGDDDDAEGLVHGGSPWTIASHRRMSSVGSSSSRGVVAPRSALEHYERASEKESEGNLGESLRLYRKAFRMDHQVDSHYREKHFPKLAAAGPSVKKTITPSGDSPSVTGPPVSSLSSRSKEVSDLVASFAGVPIEPLVYLRLEGGDGATRKGEGKGKEKEKDAEVKEVFCPLSTLPYELLLQILRTVALADVASFARLAQVCKALAYAVMTQQTIWRAVCEKTFSRILWNWEVDVGGKPLEESDDVERDPPPRDEEEVTKYGNNWRQMFMVRPRIRFNGIYIATCNYARAGASQSWNTPVYIVTYYRYLRFYPNGTALSLLSSNEPSEVVPGFNMASLTPSHLGGGGGPPVGSWSKYVSRGRWRMHGDDLVDVEVKAPMMDRYLLIMRLRIKCVRSRGRMTGVNKLMWGRFWSWNITLDDPTEFSLKNDKPFFFSRVGSIEREMGFI